MRNVPGGRSPHERHVVWCRRAPRGARSRGRWTARTRPHRRPDSPGRRVPARSTSSSTRASSRSAEPAGSRRRPPDVRGFRRLHGEHVLQANYGCDFDFLRGASGVVTEHVTYLMKVLVTGAHGKVGRALVPRLAGAGHDVRASDLDAPGLGPRRPERAGGLLAGRPDRRRRRLRARRGRRRRRPHGGDPAADPQRAARRLREQHDEHVQRARGGDRRRCAPVRALLERDGPRLHLRAPSVRAGLPPDRRGAPGPAAGRLRDREVVRRAALRSRGRARRTSAARRSGRRGCRTRGATSGTSGRSSATRPC